MRDTDDVYIADHASSKEISVQESVQCREEACMAGCDLVLPEANTVMNLKSPRRKTKRGRKRRSRNSDASSDSQGDAILKDGNVAECANLPNEHEPATDIKAIQNSCDSISEPQDQLNSSGGQQRGKRKKKRHRATEKPPQNIQCTTSVIEDRFLEESLDLPVDGSSTSGQCQPDLSSGFPSSSTTPSLLEANAEPSLMMTGEPALEHARDIHSSSSVEIKLDNNQVENSASTVDDKDVLDENIAPACSSSDFVPSEKKESRIKNDVDVEIKKKTAVPISFEAPEKTCEFQVIKSSYAEEDLGNTASAGIITMNNYNLPDSGSTENRSRILLDLGIENPRGNTSLTSDHNYDGNAGDAPARSSATGTYKRQKSRLECSDSQEVIVKAYPGSSSDAKSSDRSESKPQSLEGNDINRVEVQASISAEKIIPDCALSDLATKESKEAVRTIKVVGQSVRGETPTAFHPNKKLLVLDINGLLADIVQGIPERYPCDLIVSNKAVFRRPFCSDFLYFCFKKFNVGVWSSRAKKNMDQIIPFIFRSYERKLIFCWNALHCTKTGFNTVEKSGKPLMLKELRKLWENRYNDLPWNKGVFNETNTLLLDDSPYKALRNPAHTAVFPSPYDFRNYKDSSLGPGGDLREYLEGLADTENVQEYVSKHPFGQKAITDSDASWGFYSKIVGRESSRLEEVASSSRLPIGESDE